MTLIINLLVSTIAILISAYLIPGVTVNGFTTALLLSIVLGVINITLKPLLHLLALPITIVTLGIFALIINALLILVASSIVPGFRVDGFIAALLFSIVLSVVNLVLHNLVK